MVQMGSDVLKSNLTNPARNYLWEFEIPAPKGSGTQDIWFIRSQSVVLPGKSFEDIDINYKGTAGIRFAGRERYDHQFAVTVIEGEDKKAFDAVYSWMQLIRDNTSGEGSPDNELKTDAVVRALKNDGNLWLAVKFVGIYPKDVSEVDLNYDSSDVIKRTVTFAYDRWEEMSV